jgi:UDP-4-amino-4,6-dideoxy-N-acetyl-beta-L-altrosamine transaminase
LRNIPYGKQDINEDDIQSLVDVLKSDFLTQGPAVPAFENAVAKYCGANYAIATNSATSALHIACLALGLGNDDWLWTSPITFVASANCGLYCGARVDFVDIDKNTYNMSPEALEKKLKKAEKEGRLPKVVIPVHLCGQSSEMKHIHRLSRKYGFHIIEDASHAIGGSYNGEKVGRGRYSDITVFSFHPVKIVTTGEGGMAVTNNEKLASQMTLLRSHGVTRESDLMTKVPEGAWYYQQVHLGYNYRITDIQAALGTSQLNRLDTFVKKRHEIASRYNVLLSDVPVITPYQRPDVYSSYHLYVLRINGGKSLNRKVFFDGLRERGIGVNVHYIPLHTQPYYEKMGFKYGDFPVAEEYYLGAISLPMYPRLTESEQQYVVDSVKSICSQ